MKNLPDNKPVEDTLTMVQRLFPYKNEEELKIYGILSARADVAQLINDLSAKMIIVPAYSLDEALKLNEAAIGFTVINPKDWKMGVVVGSAVFQQLVPVDKVGDMVRKIVLEHAPTPEDRKARSVEDMEAYARYIFACADATPYEMGILTGIVNRFKAKKLQ